MSISEGGKMMKKKHIVAVMSILMAGTMTIGIAACKTNEEQQHTHNYQWYSSDANQHWKVCPDDGVIDESTRGNHDFTNGNCICGRVKPGDVIPDPVEKMSVYERADYLARAVDDHYSTYTNGEIAVAGYYNALEGDTEDYANCYEYSALITMANKILAASTDEGQKAYYKKLLDGYVAGLDYYEGSGTYTSTHGTRLWEHLYGVHRKDVKNTGDVSTDMVYDDLMWIIRDFVEIYHTTGDATYIQRAEHMTSACLDGWDSTKGGIGGITWGPTYESKHTCSNGPLISALCGLADYYKDKEDTISADETVYGEQTFAQDRLEWKNMVGMKKYDYYLEWAKQVYDFTYTYLRDSDYTFVDIVRQNGAKQVVENKSNPSQTYNYFRNDIPAKTEGETFTYNTGSVISGAAWLYRLTGDTNYLTQGRLMAEGANHFFAKTVTVDGKELQMYDCRASLLFNEVLMQGFYDLAKASKLMESDIDEQLQKELAGYVNVFKTSIEYAFGNYVVNRTLPQNYLQGWLYAGDGGAETKDTRKDVKDAAATPAILAIIAQYETEHGKLSTILGTEHEHNYTKWAYDSNRHWKVCPIDDEIDETTRGTHTFDNDEDKTCNDGCGFVRRVASDLTGTVSGTITASGSALSGATVTVDGKTATTDADGNYSVEGVLMANTGEIDITVTHPACNVYNGKVQITEGSAVASFNASLTPKTFAWLGNKTYFDLAALQTSNQTDFKHVQYSEMWNVEHGTDGHRVINDHGEGLCLHVDNNKTDDDMSTAIYQKLSITENNSNMMFRARGFLGNNDKVGLLSVRVINLTDYTVDELKQGANDNDVWYEMNSNGYVEYSYDLSAYKGKDVVVVIGAKQGNHNAIERIRFIGENENWVMPFTTAADLASLTAYTAEDVILPTNNQNGVNSIMNGTWNKVGDQSASNEGWLLKDADYAAEGSTKLRVFTYKKLTFSNVGTITVRARTFSGQNSVSSGHDGQIYPELIVRLIDNNGNLVPVTCTYNKVDNGENCQDFYFKLNGAISGNYTFVIGMARGQRLAIESIKFGGVSTTVNVTGTVKSSGVPVEGATVSYGYNRGSVTTAADGTFTLPVDIVAGGNVEVIIKKDGFADINRTVTGASDASLGDIVFIKTILPNLTTEDIAGMNVLTDTSFGTDAIKDQWRQYGDVDKHGEGTCLQANANSPAYVCAKIAIDSSKQYMKFNARMFVRDSDQRGLLQVKIIKADGTVDMLKPIRVYHGNDVLSDRVLSDGTLVNSADYYTEGVYDLTAYVGSTVVVAIIAVNDVEEVTKSIHNAINDIAFRSNSDTEFGKPAV